MIDNKKNLEKLRLNIINNSNRNVILIIGAGVSFEAANLPLGKTLAKYLVAKLGCNIGLRKLQFENELDFLEKEYHFDRDDFKTILFALNKLDSSTLVTLAINSLSKDSNNEESGIYKIIAKLFYENSVNHIINFNFDELLDKELLKYKNHLDYSQIYSDKDIIAQNKNIASKPLYIKPHGTISQRNTLRFQRKDYYKLEDKTNKLLFQIFSEKPVDLILMGFRLKFHDMSTLLSYCLKPSSKVYIIDKKEDILGKELSSSFYSGDFIKISAQFTLYDCLKCLDSAEKVPSILEFESQLY